MRMYDVIKRKRDGFELTPEEINFFDKYLEGLDNENLVSSRFNQLVEWSMMNLLIFATGMPQDATMGTTASEVLSPTPPVECLSTLMPGMGERSTMSPEAAISMVSAAVSRAFIP